MRVHGSVAMEWVEGGCSFGRTTADAQGSGSARAGVLQPSGVTLLPHSTIGFWRLNRSKPATSVGNTAFMYIVWLKLVHVEERARPVWNVYRA